MALTLRRLAAAAVDALLALLLAVLLAPTAGRWLAGRAALALRVGEPGSPWTGGLPLALGAVGELTYGLPLALTLVLLAEPLAGRTFGHARTGLAPQGGRPWLRFAVKGLGAWGPTLALASGSWPATAAAAALGAIALAGAAPLLAGGRTLHDALAGTRIVLLR